jgi:hypothetical protein
MLYSLHMFAYLENILVEKDRPDLAKMQKAIHDAVGHDIQFPKDKEETVDVICISSKAKRELEKRGRTVYVTLHGETLAMLEAQTGTKSYPFGRKAEEAATVPAMNGVEVAITFDKAIPKKTFCKPFVVQLSILKEANKPIDGVTDTYPQTPADALSVALGVNEQTGVNVLSYCTRVGKDGFLFVGGLIPGVSVLVDGSFHPDESFGHVGLLSLAVPTEALGR